MQIKFIEASNTNSGGFNHGKFMIQRFEAEEWAVKSALPGYEEGVGSALLRSRGWGPEHILVFDLQTGEGALFRHGGLASADLHKHKIWVCPLYEPFLVWLYKQDMSDLTKLPAHVDLDAPSDMAGYRRSGPTAAQAEAWIAAPRPAKTE